MRVDRAPRRFGWGPLLLIGVLATVARLPILLADVDTQLSLFADDASYYLEAARRVAEQGDWPTMDGERPTNGFHPLYMALQVGAQRLMGGDPRAVIPGTMALHLLLNVGACLMLAGACFRSRPVPGAALLAIALLAASPGWLAHGFAGLEASLAAPLLLLAALRWVRRWDPEALGLAPLDGGWTGWAVDGLILGLAMLARTDSVLFAAPYLVGSLVLEARRSGTASGVSRAVLAGTVATLLVAPWLGLNVALFGSPVQDSARALGARFDTLHGPLGSAGWAALAVKNLALWTYRLGWSWGLLPLTGWLVGLALPIHVLRRKQGVQWPPWLAVVLAAGALAIRANDPWYIDHELLAGVELLLGLAGGLAGLLTPRPAGGWSPSTTALLVGYTALTAVVYSGLIRSFQLWYTTAPVLLGVLLWTLPGLLVTLRGRRALGLALALLVGAQLVGRLHGYRTRGALEGLSDGLLESGEELAGRLGTVARERPVVVGSFDSGELSYRVHPFPIVNLDGVMNHGAAMAMSEGELAGYLEAEGVSHLIGPADRVEEYRRVSSFEVVPDPQLSARLGVEVHRIER